MNIFDKIGISTDIVVIGSIAFSMILFILIIVLLVKNSKLKKRYEQFMSGSDAASLEDVIAERFQEMDDIKEVLRKQNKALHQINDTLLTAYQKVAIVKYDAFQEMGGKLSFAIAMLNAENDGFIINSMHSSREGCYTYVKEIIKGESFVVLAEEEQQALDQAIKANDLV